MYGIFTYIGIILITLGVIVGKYSIHGSSGIYTLWLCQNRYWKWRLIVDLPMKNGESFHSCLLTFTRGYNRCVQDCAPIFL
jgi:hypothetical protein